MHPTIHHTPYHTRDHATRHPVLQASTHLPRLRGVPRFGPVLTPTVTPFVPWRRGQRTWSLAASVRNLFDDLKPASSTGRWWLAVSLACMAALMLVLWAPDAHADDSEARRAESPYFHVKSSDPTLDALPLKSTHVDVRIAGVVADVTVTQHYRNEGQRPIEAKYVFPGSTRAAVHAMQVRIGERVIAAQIREKQKARIEFEAAKREGKTSALLEQERPNVFSMNVANILPGDDIAVELRYSELIAPSEGRYAFVFPTVVGPRYRSPAQTASAAGPASAQPPISSVPYLPSGQTSNTALTMTIRFASPLPVTAIESISHAIEVTNEGTREASVELIDEPLVDHGKARNDRDLIVHYRLAGERTATGLLLAEGVPDANGVRENYFMALVEPPKHIDVAQINPRDYIFVVDISGSMHGYPLDTAKALLRKLIGQLRPSDSFNVLLFSGSADMLHRESVPATRANVDRAIATIERQRGGGSTEIMSALKRVAALPKPADVSRSIVFVTDGYVSVEQDVFALIRKHLGQSNVFAFGIGHSVNRHLIEGMARAGRGEAFIVTKPEHAAEQADRLRRMIDSPVLTALRARFTGMEVYDTQPDLSKPDALPDVLGGRPVVIVGKYRQGSANAQMVLEGQAATGSFQDVVQANASMEHANALRLLWARERIAEHADQEGLMGGHAHRDAILSLGLTHSLLTSYTSFLAVDRIVRTQDSATTIHQPSPMPKGVSNLAVGGLASSPEASSAFNATVPSTPEPKVWFALVVVAVCLLGVALRRRSLVVSNASKDPDVAR